ncbi:hypothetical protein ELI_1103 [Eubacterium callanderi]|uniref:Uncharacterized protein n=1 Tax=Eubacterium callanderi TaxID=53442 RepID=E3GKQ3_9FIRM|nr:hypothetical protein ELI_1103 [Eubacterium callanderi]
MSSTLDYNKAMMKHPTDVYPKQMIPFYWKVRRDCDGQALL